jgi:hypothetical protein
MVPRAVLILVLNPEILPQRRKVRRGEAIRLLCARREIHASDQSLNFFANFAPLR